MKRLINEPMAKHTTFRVGGAVEELVIPESEEEFIEIFRQCLGSRIPFRVLGNGSNILVGDEGLRGCVIESARSCSSLGISNGLVYCGASIKVQQFIRFCVRHDLQAPEYLFSVPATVGGAIFMNAGRGRALNQQISDSLESVRVYDGTADRVFLLGKEHCGFQHRYSIFHERRDWLILGGYFRPGPQDGSIGEARIKERMQFVKELQDYNHPTAGSVFKEGVHRIFVLARGWRCGGAQYSGKTANWINNVNNATARDIERLIWRVQLLHRLLFRKVVREIEIWK